MSEFTLNDKQQQAYDFIASRLMIPGDQDYVFCIEGKGGSGKTTLAAHIIKKHSVMLNFVVMAPSHSARSMILQSLRKAGVNTWSIPSTTVQSFVGMMPDRRKDPTPDTVLEEKFSVLGEPRTDLIGDDTVVLVDEMSMISKNMMLTMLRAIRDTGAKCIMMGDYNQIPPVEDESSQCVVEAMKQRRREYCFELDVNERANASTDIDSVAMGILDGVAPRTCRGVTVVGSHKDLLTAFTQAAEQGLRPYGVAYRNADVNNMNKMARNAMGHDLAFRNGDVVRLDGMGINFYDREAKGVVQIAYPGEFITLREVGREHEYGFPGFSGTVPVQTFQVDDFDLTFQCTQKDEWNNKKDSNLKKYMQKNLEMVLKAVEQAKKGYNKKTYFTPDKVFTPDVMKMLQDSYYFDFPTMYHLVNMYGGAFAKARGLIWANNFFGHRSKFLNMSHQFASTAHKSQGQTRPHVFVDARGMDPRMFYVATSRASESVTIYTGEL